MSVLNKLQAHIITRMGEDGMDLQELHASLKQVGIAQQAIDAAVQGLCAKEVAKIEGGRLVPWRKPNTMEGLLHLPRVAAKEGKT